MFIFLFIIHPNLQELQIARILSPFRVYKNKTIFKICEKIDSSKKETELLQKRKELLRSSAKSRKNNHHKILKILKIQAIESETSRVYIIISCSRFKHSYQKAIEAHAEKEVKKKWYKFW